MKEKYVSPTLNIVTFESESIITTSVGVLQDSYDSVALNSMLYNE